MTVVITGANRGIGQALLSCYQDQGVTVIGTSRNGTAGLAALDVTDPASATSFAAGLSGPTLDLLVCNAGVYLDKGHQMSGGYGADLWDKSFATNVTGVFLTIQALLPKLIAAKGKIAIISSQMASDQNAPGGSYIYRASKAAALNLGRNLAVDLAKDGVAVGIYHPGWVQTDMGGSSADITADQAATGLRDRFAALSLATTGCFETWDGRTIPF